MPINWLAVVRDVSIVLGLVLASSFLLVQAIDASGGEAGLVIVGFSNLFFGTLGFLISGCLVKRERFKHLAMVALGVWLVSFINVAFGTTTPQMWGMGLLLILLMMGAGGGLSYLFVQTPQTEPEALTGQTNLPPMG